MRTGGAGEEVGLEVFGRALWLKGVGGGVKNIRFRRMGKMGVDV